jgi:hypothetical protein
MAVDHLGVAYVVYNDGNLYRVSTKTAACEATSFAPDQHGFTDFGMGFVASVNDAGEGIETLYVASESTPSELGTINVQDFKLSVVAPFGTAGLGLPVNMAELTSTRDGRLFGFFAPVNGDSPSYIIQIDPRTAAIKSTVELPSVVEGGGWAFGFWGGDFYTFTAPNYTYDPTTEVTRYRPRDGTITVVATAPAGVMIVGAGVSTCAPQE